MASNILMLKHVTASEGRMKSKVSFCDLSFLDLFFIVIIAINFTYVFKYHIDEFNELLVYLETGEYVVARLDPPIVSDGIEYEEKIESIEDKSSEATDFYGEDESIDEEYLEKDLANVKSFNDLLDKNIEEKLAKYRETTMIPVPQMDLHAESSGDLLKLKSKVKNSIDQMIGNWEEQAKKAKISDDIVNLFQTINDQPTQTISGPLEDYFLYNEMVEAYEKIPHVFSQDMGEEKQGPELLNTNALIKTVQPLDVMKNIVASEKYQNVKQILVVGDKKSINREFSLLESRLKEISVEMIISPGKMKRKDTVDSFGTLLCISNTYESCFGKFVPPPSKLIIAITNKPYWKLSEGYCKIGKTITNSRITLPCSHKKGRWLINELESPLLIQKSQLQLNMFLLVTSMSPTRVHIFENGYVSFASKAKDDWSLLQLKEYLKDDADKVFAQIPKVLERYFLAAEQLIPTFPKVKTKNFCSHCAEVLQVQLVLTSDLKVRISSFTTINGAEPSLRNFFITELLRLISSRDLDISQDLQYKVNKVFTTTDETALGAVVRSDQIAQTFTHWQYLYPLTRNSPVSFKSTSRRNIHEALVNYTHVDISLETENVS